MDYKWGKTCSKMTKQIQKGWNISRYLTPVPHSIETAASSMTSW